MPKQLNITFVRFFLTGFIPVVFVFGCFAQTDADIENYIARYHKLAVKEMKKAGIPASITLAQALLESGYGKSKLARKAKNHFGIKCTGEWKGRKFYKDDDQKDECFRRYGSVKDSYRDHSKFLQRARYTELFELDIKDYKGWAYGLKKAGYATNPGYPQLLISIIERYHLDRFDKRGSLRRERKRKEARGAEPSHTSTYKVRKGDTLCSISKRFGMSVEELKLLNNIHSDSIDAGQQLKVKH